MTRLAFMIVDVFTQSRFGGNSLAVVFDAQGLDPQTMQRIAREFNFSETTFILPPERGGDRRVRIFTPRSELPFAGHPNIGSAFALATSGALGSLDAPRTLVLEQPAGDVSIALTPRTNGQLHCELTAPQRLNVGTTVDPRDVAAALSLNTADIATRVHPPRLVSVGLGFVIAALETPQALAAAKVSTEPMTWLARSSGCPYLYVYAADPRAEVDFSARMFAPLDGMPEDPATGGASAALGALLASVDRSPKVLHRWRIAQGEVMGRPSLIEVAVDKRDGAVHAVRVGGHSVRVADGTLDLT